MCFEVATFSTTRHSAKVNRNSTSSAASGETPAPGAGANERPMIRNASAEATIEPSSCATT